MSSPSNAAKAEAATQDNATFVGKEEKPKIESPSQKKAGAWVKIQSVGMAASGNPRHALLSEHSLLSAIVNLSTY